MGGPDLLRNDLHLHVRASGTRSDFELPFLVAIVAADRRIGFISVCQADSTLDGHKLVFCGGGAEARMAVRAYDTAVSRGWMHRFVSILVLGGARRGDRICVSWGLLISVFRFL